MRIDREGGFKGDVEVEGREDVEVTSQLVEKYDEEYNSSCTIRIIPRY